MSEQIVKNIIDSLCWNCTKRILHFQLFTLTASCQTTNYSWIQKYVEQKKISEQSSQDFKGCGVCFGLLEKYSDQSYLTEVF